jgi:glycosyltransferase involved in cell wall biosynthesis
MLLPFADCVVVVSNGLFELAAKEWWVPEKKIIRFYNGVDTEKFIPKNGVNLEHNPPSPNPLPLKGGEEKGEEKALDNHIVIGTVASLSPVKNQKYLIEVVQALKQKHPNIRLVIAGDGPERSHLEALVHSKGLDGAVKFLGKVEETNEIYRGFDIFALTSFGEQMPNCILEAMASGLPIVSTNVGDISEMVACPNKRFVISGDEKEALLEAFEELIANPHLRSDLGRANRLKAIQHYSIDRTVEAYRNLFGK